MLDLDDMTQWDTPFLPVSIAAKASGIAAGNLRIWFQRRRISLDETDAVPDKDGLPRLLTLRTVLRIAVTAALAKQKLPAEEGFAAAKVWTHERDFDLGPACLFDPPAMTMLMRYGPDHTNVVKVDPLGGKLAFEFHDILPEGYSSPWATNMVPLNIVDQYARRVCRRFLAEQEQNRSSPGVPGDQR